jgi:hypothetical protein
VTSEFDVESKYCQFSLAPVQKLKLPVTLLDEGMATVDPSLYYLVVWKCKKIPVSCDAGDSLQ